MPVRLQGALEGSKPVQCLLGHATQNVNAIPMAKVKGSLFGGRQTRPLPGLGGSNSGSGCLKGGKGSQKELGWQFSQSYINTYLFQFPSETSLRSPQLQACLLTADKVGKGKHSP